MVSDGTLLLRNVRANSPDDTGRLVTADWLQENGEDGRAAFIRDHTALQRRIQAAAPSDRPKLKGDLRAMEKDRIEALGLTGFIQTPHFDRGFINSGTFWMTKSHLEPFRILLANEYFKDISLLGEECLEGVKIMANMPPAQYLRSIRIDACNARFGVEGVRAFLQSPYIGQHEQLTAPPAPAPTDPNDPSLRKSRHFMPPESPAEDTNLPVRLSNLCINHAALGEQGAELIASAPPLNHLVRLELRKNEIGDAGTKAIANAPDMRLSELDLRENPITNRGAKYLAKGRALSKLERLYLSDTSIGETGMTDLAKSEVLKELKDISVPDPAFFLGAWGKAAGNRLSKLERINGRPIPQMLEAYHGEIVMYSAEEGITAAEKKWQDLHPSVRDVTAEEVIANAAEKTLSTPAAAAAH